MLCASKAAGGAGDAQLVLQTPICHASVTSPPDLGPDHLSSRSCLQVKWEGQFCRAPADRCDAGVIGRTLRGWRNMRTDNFGSDRPTSDQPPAPWVGLQRPYFRGKGKFKGRKPTPAALKKVTAIKAPSGDLIGFAHLAWRRGDLILLDFREQTRRKSSATIARMSPESMPEPIKAADMEALVRESHARMASMPVLSAANSSRFEQQHIGQSYICLPHGNKRLIPLFQVNSAGKLDSLVGEVNDLLGALSDPWGVMAWWTRENVWLGGTPLASLGKGQQEAISAAARHAVCED